MDSGYKLLKILLKSELSADDRTSAFYLERPKIDAVYTTNDMVHIPYFKAPKATSYPLDLNKGFNKYIFSKDPERDPLLHEVEKYILKADKDVLRLQPTPGATKAKGDSAATSQTEPERPTHSERTTILTQQGVLTRVMLTPYQLIATPKHDMVFHATKYCGILHLVEPGWRANRKTKSDTYHAKFGQYCFADSPDKDPNTDAPVDENDAHFGIYRTSLQKYDIIYAAEIAGIISDHKMDDVYCSEEINKCRFIATKLFWKSGENEDIEAHPIYLLWWLQSYLTNTNDICIGLNDSDGIVRAPVQCRRVQDMPKNQKWKPYICLRFLHTMLQLVEETMASVDCPYTVYEFRYDSIVQCIKYKIHNKNPEYSFISEEFINYLKNWQKANSEVN